MKMEVDPPHSRARVCCIIQLKEESGPDGRLEFTLPTIEVYGIAAVQLIFPRESEQHIRLLAPSSMAK